MEPTQEQMEEVVTAHLAVEGLTGDAREVRRMELMGSDEVRVAAAVMAQLDRDGRIDLPGGSVTRVEPSDSEG